MQPNKMSVLHDEPCMVRPSLIDMSPAELKYYPFVNSLNKRTGSCNILFPKFFVPKETRDINFKAFNKIADKNEAKAITEHMSFDYKFKLVQHI